MNPEYEKYGRSYGMPAMTEQRRGVLQKIVQMPQRGPMTQYVQDKARIELLAHEMGNPKKRRHS